MASVTKQQIKDTQVLEPQVLEPQVLEPQVLEPVTDGYVCPLTVNYVELEALLAGKSIADYIGKNLPENEVKRIENDYKIYLKNK